MKKQISIPPIPYQVIERLNRYGHSAYVVGGCVRDSLLGNQPQDWDVCTSALPDEIMDCFSCEKTVLTGVAHGTVTVVINHLPIEITTYRIDGSYSDGRHPDGVRFTRSLTEDLSRRDFTVNAMAYHPKEGLIDPFGGREDLERRVLSCVGDPTLRFQEDALRILRAYRFASQLGFSLEPNTRQAADSLLHTLCRVAKERIYQECCKMLRGKWAQQVLMGFPDMMTAVFPFWRSDSLAYLKQIDRLPPHLSMRWASVYGENPRAKEAMIQLRAPTKVVQEVSFLAQQVTAALPSSISTLQRQIYQFGWERTRLLADFKKALGLLPLETEEALAYVQNQRLCCGLEDLAITGNDLLQAGFLAGPSLGVLLERLLFAVMDGQIPNQKENLLQLAQQIVKKT